MFHFHEPLGFLNAARDSYDPFGTRDKQYYSTSEHVSGILYGLTYWGDYGGDSISRYHYDYLLENCGHIVTSVEGAYGQGLVLTHVFYPVDERGIHALDREDFDSSEIRFLRDFMAWAVNAPSSQGLTRDDYPVFDDNDYSDWEFHKIESILDEDIDGYLKWDVNREIDQRTDYDGSEDSAEPEEIRDAIWYILEKEGEYPYFESATSVIYPGCTEGAIVDRILAVRNGDAQSHQDESLF